MSTAGTVTGIGSLARNNISSATCSPLGSDTQVGVDDLAITYTATNNGAQRTGTATVSMLGVLGLGLDFNENFASNGAVQKQCKHGEWQSVGTGSRIRATALASSPPAERTRLAGRSSAEMRLLPKRPRARGPRA
jgi:hypothetical protein